MPPKYIRFDWAIKKLLRQKANFKVLEGFLSVLLKDDITIDRILESESNQDTFDDKYNRVDILAESSKNEMLLIEVQVNKEIDYFQRMLFGTSKVVTEYLNLGDDYAKIRKIISVNIVYFDLGQGEDYVYHGKTEFTGIHNFDTLALTERQKKLFNQSELYGIFPEYYVLKVNQFNDIAKDSLDEWIYYLKNSDVKKGSKAKGLDIVKEKMDFERMTKIEKKTYIRHLENMAIQRGVIKTSIDDGYQEGLHNGMKEGIEKGIEKGKHEANLEIAREMIADGETDEKIVKYTKLSKEEISELRKS